jgi:hypothetical protein
MLGKLCRFVFLFAILPGVQSSSLQVTQSNIHSTICRPGWVDGIRPSARYSVRVKRRLFRSSHLPGLVKDYQLNHIIPLGLGGNPRDIRNLILEANAEAILRDVAERRLHDEVCAGRMSLADAQRQIVCCWRKK